MGSDNDGVVILHLAVFSIDRAHNVADLSAVGAGGTGKAVEHVVGGHLFAIVEINIVAELESPVQIINLLPLCGQQRSDLTILVITHQGLINGLQRVN